MEENNTAQKQEKKPIYKKWWFWVIIVIVVIAMASSGSDNTSNTTSSTNVSSSSNTSTNSTKTIVEDTRKKISVIDFSEMSEKEIQNWCNKNNIKCEINEEYSSKVKKGNFISQNIKASDTIYEGDTITITYSLGEEPTLGEKNALNKAHSYLNVSAFSYDSLIKQLEYEGFSKSEAIYGADNCDADWNEQAAKKAKSYMSVSSFSKSRLIEQLEYEGFTTKQAEYGAKAVGY